MESKTKAFDAKAQTLWGNEWFWPILEDLERFEAEVTDLFPVVVNAIADDAPDWAFQAVWRSGLPSANFTGLSDPQKIGAVEVGKMVGSKWSLCEFHAENFRTVDAYTPEMIREHDANFGIFNHFQTKERCRVFAENLIWQCDSMRRNAMNLAMEAVLEEELKYLNGYRQGLQFMDSVLKDAEHPPEHDRGKNALLRSWVMLYAMRRWPEIEKKKADWSWPELHQEFQKMFGTEIQEDTFKRIFYDLGLKGVGKVGRIPSNEIGMPKIPRRH
ncbi:MAG: hypothetical protein NTZ46_09970 [Verrucomicrobia bacterium]|nr:hypothetical protein [Verrucomicrobiota bacterium]